MLLLDLDSPIKVLHSRLHVVAECSDKPEVCDVDGTH